jgi:hypothetical protein
VSSVSKSRVARLPLVGARPATKPLPAESLTRSSAGEWFTSTGEFVESHFAESLQAALRDHL